MKISFNKLNKRDAKDEALILASFKKVLRSGSYILGPEVEKFEKAFGNYIGTKHAIGVGNGLEALQISLMALGIGPGDEVITTSLSAVATALAIKNVGAKPIFIDIDVFYHVDAEKIEEKITSKTKAIIPVHLYGQAADLDKISDIAKKHNLYVVEDCAQAHGALYKNKKVGSFGKLGCFSFYPTKNLGGIGDGGMITTNDYSLAEKCRMLRNYGQVNRYEHKITGMNSRLDEIQATILSLNLKKLDKNNKKREMIAISYLKELSNIPEIELPEIRNGVKHVYHLFLIKTEKRDNLQAYLLKKGISTLIHYPIPIHKQACFKEFNHISLPQIENVTQRIISLPLHPNLSKREIEYVSQNIRAFFKK